MRPIELDEPPAPRSPPGSTAEPPTTPRRVAARASRSSRPGCAALLARDAVVSLAVDGRRRLPDLRRRRARCCGSSTSRAIRRRRAARRRPRRRARRPASPPSPPGRARRGGLVVAASPPSSARAARRPRRRGRGACNGHVELCDRPLDRGRARRRRTTRCRPRCRAGSPPSRTARSPASSSDGIRGLLIDTHYADRLPNGAPAHRTSAARASCSAGAAQDGVSPDAVDAALRIRERLGFAGEGERGMYLCHTFCELGGDAAGAGARATSTTSSSPTRTRSSSSSTRTTSRRRTSSAPSTTAGLGRLAYRGPTDGRLADAARDDRPQPARRASSPRTSAGAAPWYHLAYKAITEETPYTFAERRRSSPTRRGCPRAAGRTAGRRARRCSSSTTGSRPTRCRCRPTREAVNAYDPLLRARPALRADPRPHPEPRRGQLLPPRRRCSAWSTRSTASAGADRPSALRGGARDRSSGRRTSSATSCSPR